MKIDFHDSLKLLGVAGLIFGGSVTTAWWVIGIGVALDVVSIIARAAAKTIADWKESE